MRSPHAGVQSQSRALKMTQKSCCGALLPLMLRPRAVKRGRGGLGAGVLEDGDIVLG